MPFSPTQQQMLADLGNAVSQLQGAVTQIQKIQPQFAQDSATNMASHLKMAQDIITPVLTQLQEDLNVMNDLANSP